MYIVLLLYKIIYLAKIRKNILKMVDFKNKVFIIINIDKNKKQQLTNRM